MAGPRLAAAAEAAEAQARPGVTLRPFAPFSGAAEADEGGGDWSFIDCEMEEVDLQDLPSATIACHLDPRVFVDGLCRVRAGPGGPSGRRADTCCPEEAGRRAEVRRGWQPRDARTRALAPGVALRGSPVPERLSAARSSGSGSSAAPLRSAGACHCFPATPLRPVGFRVGTN